MKGKLESYDELKNCTFVKTILMILVLFYHCIVFWTGNWFTKNPVDACEPLSVLASWMNSFHIYGFTLVSGYLFYYLKIELGKYDSFTAFLKNKAKRLLVPYVFISIAWVIPINLMFYDESFGDVLKKHALGTNPSQLWFLLMIFWVFIIFWLMSKLMKNKTVAGFLFLGAIYVAMYVMSDYIPNLFGVKNVPEFLFAFWIGFKLRQFKDSKFITAVKKVPPVIYLAVHIVAFAVNRYIFAISDGIIFNVISLGLGIFTHLFGAVMIFLLLQRIALMVKWDTKTFGHISKCSMPTYLIHQQLVYFCIFPLNGVITPYILGPLTAVAVFLVSLLISSILLKFKVTRFLIGEK